MPTAPSDPPEIGALPDSPSRFTDSPDEFSTKSEAWSDSLPTYSDDVDAVAEWTNSTAQGVYDNAVEANIAAGSAGQYSADAQTAAQTAEASANFIGVWSDLAGSVSVGQSVFHNSAYWVALVDITDITASEPGVSSDWSITGSLSLVRFSKLNNPLVYLFKKNKLVDTPSGALSTSRSTALSYSDRYGTVQTAAIDDMREESYGWRFDGAITNYCIYSEDFSTWVQTLTTVTSDAVSSPIDGVSADKIIATSTAGFHIVNRFATTSFSYGTVSIMASAAEYTSVGLDIWNSTDGVVAAVTVDLSDGSIIDSAGSPSVVVRPSLVSGWYEIYLTNTTEMTATSSLRIFPNVRTSFTGDDTSGVYVTGAMFTDLEHPASYVPTTDSAVTTTQDDVTFDAYGNMPDTTGAWGVSFKMENVPVNAGTDSVNSHAILGFSGSESIRIQDGSLVVQGDAFVTLATDLSGNEHITLSFDGAAVTAYVDGSYSGSGSVDIAQVTSGDIYVGTRATGFGRLYGNLTDLRMHDFALNASEAAFLAGE